MKQEQYTLSISGGGSVGGKLCTCDNSNRIWERLMGQTSAKASVLVISSLKIIVEERSCDNIGSLGTKQ